MKPEIKTRIIVCAGSAILGLSTLPDLSERPEHDYSWDAASQKATPASSSRSAHDPNIRRYPSKDLIDAIRRSDTVPSPTPKSTPSSTIY